MIPITVLYNAPDYFKLAESETNGIKVYDLDKLDPNINKTSVMLLADPKVPLKDFRLTADNRLLSKNTLYFWGTMVVLQKMAIIRLKKLMILLIQHVLLRIIREQVSVPIFSTQKIQDYLVMI